MPDFRVADTAPEHHKLRAAGLAAAGLWALAGAFSMRELTDGWVPTYWVKTWPSGAKQAAILVRVGLWEKEDRAGIAGFRFHDWTQYQRLAQRFAEEREQNRQRAQRHRDRTRTRDVPPGVTRDEHRDSRTTNGFVTGAPSPSPLPTTDQAGAVGSSEGRASARRAAERVGPAHSGRAHRLVETYVATCARRPPAKLRGQLAVEVDGLIEVGWPDGEITAAIDLWASKGLGPGALGSVAHELANRRPAAAQRSSTDANIAALLAGRLEPDADYPPLRAIEGA